MQRGKETERKIFHLMIHSPSERNGRCYADPKRGASSGSPTRGTRSQVFGPSLTAFPGYKVGTGWDVELLEPCTHMGDLEELLAPGFGLAQLQPLLSIGE